MSAQNPPPGQPTPEDPNEGVGPTENQEAAAPPPPPVEGSGEVPAGETTPPPAEGGPIGEGAPPPPPPYDPAVGPTDDGTPPPPPPPAKKSRTGLIIGLIAGLVVLALIAIAAVFFLTKGEDEHSIAIPAKAGGMERNTTKEKALKQQIDAIEQQFKTQAKNVTYVKSGVYTQDDTKRGPKGDLLFLGAKLNKNQSPTKFVTSFSKQAGANGYKITKIKAGDAGGKAVCASQSSSGQAICAWATKDSMGELVPTVYGYDSEKLSKLLLDLRDDVEDTE